MKRSALFLSVAALIGCLFVSPVLAQDKAPDDMQILLEKIKTDKKLLIAESMDLTESEAKGFWPVYEEYQKDLAAINQRMAKLIQSYVKDYDANTLTDEKARKHTAELVAVQQENGGIQGAYLSKLNKVLPPKKVARYLQIENKIRAVVLYQIAIDVPIVE